MMEAEKLASEQTSARCHHSDGLLWCQLLFQNDCGVEISTERSWNCKKLQSQAIRKRTGSTCYRQKKTAGLFGSSNGSAGADQSAISDVWPGATSLP